MHSKSDRSIFQHAEPPNKPKVSLDALDDKP